MKRFAGINTIIGLLLGMLLWTAPPVWAAAVCKPNIRATTPTGDFTLNDSNGTATHLKTGLIWMRCSLGQNWDSASKTCTGSPATYTWGAALRAAQGTSFAGYSDWRLPNAKELGSIVEERCWIPSINETVFPTALSDGDSCISVTDCAFWSTTTFAGNPAFAWPVNFGYGVVNSTVKSFDHHVRLVRGGQWFGDYGGGGGSGAPVTLEVLDGRDFRAGAGLSTDPTVLGSLSKNRWMDGAAADGEARLVLRARTSQPTSVTFSIPAGDGELTHYLGAPSGSSVTVPTVPVGGKHMAFAIFRAPEQFPRAGHPEDESIARRDIPLTVNGPGGGLVIQMLVLERPPVVLIHGLYANRDVWDNFKDHLEDAIDGIHVYPADYRKKNQSNFSDNKMVPVNEVIKAKNDYRSRRIVAVQADVFGHSMGGILSRIWAEDTNTQYRTDRNYQSGDFNKLVTIDTPHKGSWWALILWGDDTKVELVEYLEKKLFGASSERNSGAHKDLLPGSDALDEMNSISTQVPSHVIVGNPTLAGTVDLADFDCLPATSDIGRIARAYCWSWKIAKLVGYDTTVSYNFPLGGDLIVGAPSQRDGFQKSSDAVSEFGHVHWNAWDGLVGALESDQVLNKSVYLLLDFSHLGGGSKLIQQDLPILRGQYVRFGLIH